MTRRILVVALSLASLYSAREAVAQSAPESGAGQVAVADADATRKAELVAMILAARENATGRAFSPALRARLERKLRSAPISRLEAFHNAGGLGDIETLAHGGGPYAVGSSDADLVFTPVPPCRIVDTRSAGGQLTPSVPRSLYVNGNTGGTFESQGGTAGGCGIPDDATAVEMNFVAVTPAGQGNLRAYPWSASPTTPNASVINYSNTAGMNIANGIAQPLCNAAVDTCTFDLIAEAKVSATHLIIDVVGYYHRVPVNSFAAATNFSEGPATSTSTNQVTIVSTSIDVAGPGKIVAIGSAESFCIAGCTTAGTDFVSGYMNVTTTAGGNPQDSPRSFFFTGRNQSNSLTRTLEFSVGSAGNYTFYLRGQRSGGNGTDLGFYRGQLQLFFLPN